jgi:L-fuculokinase
MVPVIAIFDIGKTNKKLFLFDEDYNIVHDQTQQINEIVDEDGDPCEDLQTLTGWAQQSLKNILALTQFRIKAINFSAYGASFVNIDEVGKPVTPLYNYLKKYPQQLQQQFYKSYGGEAFFSIMTASPVLGNLNSGMQLYWLKYHHLQLFKKINYALHLPQYLSYLITLQPYSDVTSIGCHTNLWNFPQNNYHEWVLKEGIIDKLPPIVASNECIDTAMNDKRIKVGVGLHDSSAALIPYLANFVEPFVLISTGTWCISLNPFNKHALTENELKQDCLCYLSYKGEPVKASRLFAGDEHETAIKKLANYFNKPIDYFKTVNFNPSILPQSTTGNELPNVKFIDNNLNLFANYETAYHALMLSIMQQQIQSTSLIIQDDSVKRIFVDGGFSKNTIYMHLLAKAFPHMEVYAANVAQATACGAALAIHTYWNTKPLPADIIDLKLYTNQ